MRIKQKAGVRGSLKFIQHLVNEQPALLSSRIAEAGGDPTLGAVRWVSPRQDDEWAEYRDEAFLSLVGHPELAPALKAFWPSRGPQWDALGIAGDTVVLVEAKAHVGEMASSCAATSTNSLKLIRKAFDDAKADLGAAADRDWMNGYYQLANRLAHLWFLRSQNVDARLVLLQFTGETGMPTSSRKDDYAAAMKDATNALGLSMWPGALITAYIDTAELR